MFVLRESGAGWGARGLVAAMRAWQTQALSLKGVQKKWPSMWASLCSGFRLSASPIWGNLIAHATLFWVRGTPQVAWKEEAGRGTESPQMHREGCGLGKSSGCDRVPPPYPRSSSRQERGCKG